MLEQLVVELGGGALAAQLGRHGGDRRLEHLAQPASGRGRFGNGRGAGALEPRAIGGDVVEQPARLVLLGVEAGEVEQPAPVVTGL
jgi:hypothetical protein